MTKPDLPPSPADPSTLPPDSPAAQSSVTTPTDDSTEVQLGGSRLYFQTRDTITLSIDEDVIQGAPTFSVLNTTNSGSDDSKAVTVIQEAVPSLGLADDRSFSLDQVSDGKLVLSFYPGQDNYQGKFFYGKNTLKVVANDDINPRFAIVVLTLQDFSVFDVAVTSFSTNIQVATQADPNGYQFQGWVNVVGPASVSTSDHSALTTGLFNMVNPAF
jgi:hypothetical protein